MTQFDYTDTISGLTYGATTIDDEHVTNIRLVAQNMFCAATRIILTVVIYLIHMLIGDDRRYGRVDIH